VIQKALASIALCSALLWAGSARAAAITGGDTTMLWTVDLVALDVGVSPTGGTTALGGQAFLLPITGGAVTSDLSIGSIEHDGSGFDVDFGNATVRMENLRFDLSEKEVVGDLSSGPLSISGGIFDLKHCVDAVSAEVPCTGASGANNEYGLFLKPQAADFFENDVFGDVVFDDDDQILLATVNPTTAPEPASLGWLALGLGAAALVRRRARSSE